MSPRLAFLGFASPQVLYKTFQRPFPTQFQFVIYLILLWPSSL